MDYLRSLHDAELVISLNGMMNGGAATSGSWNDEIFDVLTRIGIYTQSEDRVYKSRDAEQSLAVELIAVALLVEDYRGLFELHHFTEGFLIELIFAHAAL